MWTPTLGRPRLSRLDVVMRCNRNENHNRQDLWKTLTTIGGLNYKASLYYSQLFSGVMLKSVHLKNNGTQEVAYKANKWVSRYCFGVLLDLTYTMSYPKLEVKCPSNTGLLRSNYL